MVPVIVRVLGPTLAKPFVPSIARAAVRSPAVVSKPTKPVGATAALVRTVAKSASEIALETARAAAASTVALPATFQPGRASVVASVSVPAETNVGPV